MIRKGMKTLWFVALLAVMAALALAGPAFAGGWVVVTLDSLPANLAAGEPVQIGMMVRQHGVSAWEADSLAIRAEHVETGELAEFTALPDGEPGHYSAELIFPVAGTWEWGVSSGMFPDEQPMPDLEVGGSTAARVGAAAASPGSFSLPAAGLAVSALAALAAGLVLIVRGRARPLMVACGAGLLILFAGLAFASYSSVNARAKQPMPVTGVASAPVEDPAVLGQQLFLAKGCIVCHTNDRALRSSAEFGVAMGPDLTRYQNDPNYIHTKLKDPKAMNPSAKMPQLNLKVDEIEALVAFINDHE